MKTLVTTLLLMILYFGAVAAYSILHNPEALEMVPPASTQTF